jgi:hypothetical protein
MTVRMPLSCQFNDMLLAGVPWQIADTYGSSAIRDFLNSEIRGAEKYTSVEGCAYPMRRAV